MIIFLVGLEGCCVSGYDDGAYWDKRYGDWASDPYDWLVEFKGHSIAPQSHKTERGTRAEGAIEVVAVVGE